MQDTAYRAVAVVGLGAVLPDAPNVEAFWKNVTSSRYSISDVSPDRWDPALYYDPDRNAPDKTYSKIGGWVREFEWDPLKWHLAIPPRVADAMDNAQRWGIACTREALADYGYPARPLPTERTAVILGNAMAGERHYLTALRAYFPEYARELEESASFVALPAAVRRDIRREWSARMGDRLPPITEDSMPGELANCLAGRIANAYNFHGPNYVCDAACASAMAAIRSAAGGLIEHEFDVAVTGGIDRNMGASTFIKFCKIGALSGSGSRPYAEGADGFVMGEGAAIFLMKRLADAERDGDKIYAVLRGMGASSDGKGKGITAPNPVGQKLAVERGWENAGLSPSTATLIEGHGTSTSVGDVVEVESITGVLKEHGTNGHAIALGSVKSNFGHLKGAAGAAGILKTVLALHHKVLPPSVRCERPNPNINFAHSPLYVNTELRSWTTTVEGARRAAVSAFGFGGTNFHAVLEEYIPHKLASNGKRSVAVGDASPAMHGPAESATSFAATGPHSAGPGGVSRLTAKAPLRGALVVGAASATALGERLREIQADAAKARVPENAPPREADLRAAERVAIDYGNAQELAEKCAKAIKALPSAEPAVWRALRAQGIFRGQGAAPKVAFLYPGQGSQYVNMMAGLRAAEPIVSRTFEEADRVMAPLLGKPLTQYVFADPSDATAVARAEADLQQTAITQPAVLATDLALTRLLAAYGIEPDFAMGHSLGEYGALVAAGALPFEDALEAVSARGREMTRVSVADNGRMAAVFAPLPEVERVLKTVDGYAVIANYNSDKQVVIGGATRAMDRAAAAFQNAGYELRFLPVSHAFHTEIVAPASGPMRATLERLHLQPPQVPVVANVNGGFYPMGAGSRTAMLEILARQIASPVQFIQGLRTLYEAGARVFVEVGPKKALHGFVEDVLGSRPDVLALFTNHPKLEDATAFNQALCGLYASGLGASRAEREEPVATQPVVITGAALGLPGTERIFDDHNVSRILKGEQFIDVIPIRCRKAMLDKHITRLVKSDNGGPSFEQIHHASEVVKLAGRGGAFDLEAEFGVPAERIPSLDRVTRLAMAAGIDALRDAGIPLVLRYKSTSNGKRLPDRWGLPDALRDDTGVIFASVWPGWDSFADEAERFYSDRARRDQLALLEDLARISNGADPALRQEFERRIADLHESIGAAPYHLDRQFLFRVLSMGHSQFAEYIGARGPNTHVNAACASTTQAVAVAEDWIRAGRCRRVIVVSADDITSERMIGWFGAGFLASGAAATDDIVEEAATPFDRRRHGMIIGMGAAALVVESAEAAAERGLQPICEVLGAVTANSAFHGTRLDVEHIGSMMEEVVRQAEARSGIRRDQLAPEMVFVSHETYTPARGGSASAEIFALRKVFGDAVDRIVIANTKGFTGHAMGAGIEDVVAVKALETGVVPPVANFKEVDPELGPLNLSRGGAYPVQYALRLGAGFGSQISMTLMRRADSAAQRPKPNALGYAYRIADRAAWDAWLERIAGQKGNLEVVHRTLRIAAASAVTATVEAPPPHAPDAAVVPAELPAPAPAPAPAITSPPLADTIAEHILALVVEKTGYPRDMLDLDLDLEADLGVDTVKQAEMFAAIREHYQIPRDPSLKLRDYPTLARVIQFVRERQPMAAPAAPIVLPAPIVATLDPIREKVLDIVADKTGYPKDMLDVELDLEADLGIDTVKQAEMFASVRAAFGIPRDQTLRLRDFPTLGHVIRFAQEAHAPAPEPPKEPEQKRAASEPEHRIPRRVPVAVLRPPLDLCAATGVAIGPANRVLVVPDRGGVAEQLTAKLQRLGATVVERLDGGAPIDGVYWLPALDDEGPLSAMTAESWHAAIDARVKAMYRTMRTLFGQISAPGTFLVSATRLGGRHGYDDAGATAPMGGAVTGFTKAYKRERPDVLVKAVDYAVEADPAAIADALIAETLHDPGAVEIGYAAGHRWTIGLEERAVEDGLNPSAVFVVTGAAGSIVSAITADLAAASGGTFHLLDIVPEPDPADPDLKRFATDKEGLKRDLFTRLQARGERATPALVERELAAMERSQAAAHAIEAISEAGGTASYYSVDLTNGDAVAKVIERIRQRSGRIDVLLHAAGVDRSHPLPDKEPREFDLVFDVKCDGCFHLLRAIGDMPVETIVFFSSIAGRFGNAAQTDYSAANDLLCKIASSFRRTRPETRALAIDWTAWGGMGMATRGSIPKVMEMAGIEMLPPAVGIPWVRRELAAGGPSGEVVAAGNLGLLLQNWHAAGGLESASLPRGVMTAGSGDIDLNGVLTFETKLDPVVQPFLHDHAIDGTPVLPGVMGVEAFAEAALTLAPGWHLHTIEEVDFAAPFKFYRGEPRVVTVEMQLQPQGNELLAQCRLVGKRKLANELETQATIHFTGKARLSRSPRESATAGAPPRQGAVMEAGEIYSLYFHGPAYQVLQRAWCTGGMAVGELASALPAHHHPGSLSLALDPRLLELCFQTAGIWEMASVHRMGLPRSIGSVSVYDAPTDLTAPLYAVITPERDGECYSASVVDADGRCRLQMSGYRTVVFRENVDTHLFLAQEAGVV